MTDRRLVISKLFFDGYNRRAQIFANLGQGILVLVIADLAIDLGKFDHILQDFITVAWPVAGIVLIADTKQKTLTPTAQRLGLFCQWLVIVGQQQVEFKTVGLVMQQFARLLEQLIEHLPVLFIDISHVGLQFTQPVANIGTTIDTQHAAGDTMCFGCPHIGIESSQNGLNSVMAHSNCQTPCTGCVKQAVMLTLMIILDDFYVLFGIHTMSQIEKDSSTELEALEAKLDALIAEYNAVKNENKSLKTKQDALVKEKAKLLEKTTLAKARVEAMIARLKAMEHDA